MNKNNLNIRLENETEYREVENLVRESFWNVYRPGCLEHFVLHELRKDPDFVPELDFVLEKDGKIKGIFLRRVTDFKLRKFLTLISRFRRRILERG